MSAKTKFAPALLIVVGLISAVEATAVNRSEQEAVIGACIRRASEGRSWLERTLWALRDQEAGWVGAEVSNANGTHDLGPLQVNSAWVGPIAAHTGRDAQMIRHWLANDACFNVSVARWIFLTSLASTGDYWRAIGAYHSPTAWRQLRYSSSVASKLKRRFGVHAFAASAGALTPNAIQKLPQK